MMDKGYRNFKEQTLLILERGMVSDHLSRDELAAETEIGFGCAEWRMHPLWCKA